MGGEGAWAWERWESVGGCGRSSGEEGGVWAASGYLRGPYGLPRTVGKWCPVWGDLEHPVPLIWRAWPSGSPIGKLLGLGRGVLRGWCELLCVRLVETWTGRSHMNDRRHIPEHSYQSVPTFSSSSIVPLQPPPLLSTGLLSVPPPPREPFCRGCSLYLDAPLPPG